MLQGPQDRQIGHTEICDIHRQRSCWRYVVSGNVINVIDLLMSLIRKENIRLAARLVSGELNASLMMVVKY